MISNFLRVVCSILYNKNFLPFKMQNSSNGNNSETSEQTETFNSSEDCRWSESPSSEDEYDADW